jgi:hypothetical protein
MKRLNLKFQKQSYFFTGEKMNKAELIDQVAAATSTTKAQAEKVVDALKAEGFNTSDISVLLPESSGSQDFAHTKATKAPEGAATGAGTGAVIGGTLGLLAGIGLLAIPGIGPFIAAGPIMAALAGAGVGGAIGGISGALIGLGVPEYEAKRYEGYIKSGGILISVHAKDAEQVTKAKECLKFTGAEDIATSGEVKGEWKSFPLQPKGVDDKTSSTNMY